MADEQFNGAAPDEQPVDPQLQWMRDLTLVVAILGLNASTGGTLRSQPKEMQADFMSATQRLCLGVGIDVKKIETPRIIPAKFGEKRN